MGKLIKKISLIFFSINGVTAGVAAGLFTIAANTGPLKDEVLSQAGANLVFPSIEALCNEWEELITVLK